MFVAMHDSYTDYMDLWMRAINAQTAFLAELKKAPTSTSMNELQSSGSLRSDILAPTASWHWLHQTGLEIGIWRPEIIVRTDGCRERSDVLGRYALRWRGVL